MIARTWQGWTSPELADNYQRHYESEVAEHLRHVPGFLGGHLLRRVDGDSILFTSITFFSNLDAIRSFAGDDPEQAVVEEGARQALIRWDDRVAHHEVNVTLGRHRDLLDGLTQG